MWYPPDFLKNLERDLLRLLAVYSFILAAVVAGITSLIWYIFQ